MARLAPKTPNQGSRAGYAAGLQGKGSCKRSVFHRHGIIVPRVPRMPAIFFGNTTRSACSHILASLHAQVLSIGMPVV